jgi:hypothetical protein
MRQHRLVFKYGRSKAKGKEGMGTGTCYLNGSKVATTVGEGYDKESVLFAEMLQKAFGKRLLEYVKAYPDVFKRYDDETDKAVNSPIVKFFPAVRVWETKGEITRVELLPDKGISELYRIAERIELETIMEMTDTFLMIDRWEK